MADKKPTTKDTMGLWNSVCETDPALTKKVSQRGGFTAVCAQSQIKAATLLWGPYGSKWGVKDCQWSSYPTASGAPAEIILDAVFYYPSGEFELGCDGAYRAGGDTRKKLLTDLTTKALSKLGFNSDVFEGKYDDNKYITEMSDKYAEQPKDTPPKKSADKKPPAKEPSIFDGMTDDQKTQMAILYVHAQEKAEAEMEDVHIDKMKLAGWVLEIADSGYPSNTEERKLIESMVSMFSITERLQK